MFWKILDVVEFDANEGSFTSEVKSVLGVIMARNEYEAKQWFIKLMQCGIIRRASSDYVIEKATEDEYAEFTAHLLEYRK